MHGPAWCGAVSSQLEFQQNLNFEYPDTLSCQITLHSVGFELARKSVTFLPTNRPPASLSCPPASAQSPPTSFCDSCLAQIHHRCRRPAAPLCARFRLEVLKPSNIGSLLSVGSTSVEKERFTQTKEKDLLRNCLGFAHSLTTFIGHLLIAIVRSASLAELVRSHANEKFGIN